jgi:hypothetical protein
MLRIKLKPKLGDEIKLGLQESRCAPPHRASVGMIRTLAYGTVREGPRKIIHVVRVPDDVLECHEVVEIAEKMCARALSKYGDQAPAVVVIQSGSKETLRLFGESVAVSRSSRNVQRGIELCTD